MRVLHTHTFGPVKVNVSAIYYIHSVIQPPLSSSRTFSLLEVETRHPLTITPHSLLPTSPWQPPVSFLSLWIYLFWTIHIHRIRYVACCVWSLSITPHNVCKVYLQCCIYNSFLTAEYYFTVWIGYNWFIHSSVDGCVGCSHVLAIVHSVPMNMYTHVFVWVFVFQRSGSLWHWWVLSGAHVWVVSRLWVTVCVCV